MTDYEPITEQEAKKGEEGLLEKFFDIFFSDLNEDAQKRLMEAVGITDPAEMNWDIDMCPIGMYPMPYKEEEEVID